MDFHSLVVISDFITTSEVLDFDPHQTRQSLNINLFY